MAYGDQREVAQLRVGLPKAQESPTANVDKYPRLRVDPEELTGRRAIAVDPGATRAQDLDGYQIRSTALSQRARWNGEQGKQANNRAWNHERASFYRPWFQKPRKAARLTPGPSLSCPLPTLLRSHDS
jgi:hypothetical protein